MLILIYITQLSSVSTLFPSFFLSYFDQILSPILHFRIILIQILIYHIYL